jgi:regulator of sigma E protease
LLESPSLLLTILAFLLLLGPLVVVHELGHYLVARWFGVRSDAFSVGFGKELFGRTDKHGTRWKVCALPLGGYVQFAGDANAASMPDAAAASYTAEQRKGLFQFAPLWQRSLIVAAGPVTNFLVAIAIFAAFNFAYGKVVAAPVIGLFGENSSAQAAGLKIGDRIVRINDHVITSFTDIPEYVLPFPGRTVTVHIKRDEQIIQIPVKIRDVVDRDKFGNENHIGRIGIGPGARDVVKVGPVEAVTLAGGQTASMVSMMITGIGQIISGERSVKELGGPIKIAKFSGEQLSLGWRSFVSFSALISINLAFINLLPIPGLDGGHLAFYAAEAVRRKPVSAQGQEWAFRMGMALVLAFMLFVTVIDVASLAKFGG